MSDLGDEAVGSALREQHETLARIVQSCSEAIIGKTLDGIVTYWNAGAEQIYGYKAEEVIGKPISLLVPSDRHAEAASILGLIREGKSFGPLDTVRIAKNGRMVDVSINIAPIRDKAGNIVGTSSVARDVTSQKQAEAALRESEEHYRLLFEHNPLPMWVYDRSTLRFLAVNEAAVEEYGYSRREFLQMTIRDIRPAEDLAAFLDTISKPYKGLSKFGVWRHRRKNGSILFAEITSHDFNFRGTEADLVLAHDVTERVRNEELLRQSEERFSKAFHFSPLATTLSTRVEGRYIDANDAFLRLLNYDSKDLVGHTVAELGIWVDPEARNNLMRLIESQGRADRLKAQFRSRSGEVKQVHLSAQLIDLDGQPNPCLLAVMEDVTAAERLERQFRQAQRMEAVGRLAGGIAHDFNNILGVILGYGDLLGDRFQTDPLAEHQIEEIKKAASRAASLTRQLLAFSRQQVLRPRVINVNAVVQDVTSMLHRMIGEDVQLTVHTREGVGNVSADPTQIEQILMNLAVNGRDAMPEGGKLTIETSNAELDETYVGQHPGARTGSYVMISVSDSGWGIDPKVMPHIFEPFFTTKAVGQGTGLGLSTVYGAVKQSGGYIWVYSEPGRGTTFKIYLPRVDAPAQEEPSVEKVAPALAGTETILVVEDDEVLRQMTGDILKRSGYSIIEAPDPATAVRVAKSDLQRLDLLLTDWVMPQMSGWDLAQELTRLKADLRVLYMSGYSNDLTFRSGNASISELSFLEKPFTRNSLLQAVRRLLDR